MLYWVIAVLFCFNMVWLLWWGMFFIWTWFLQCSLFLIGIYTKTAVNWWIKSGLGDFFSLILSVNLELETISVSPQRKCFFQFSWKTHICVHEKFILITVRLSSFLGNVVKISKVLQEKIKGAVWSMAVYVWKKKKKKPRQPLIHTCSGQKRMWFGKINMRSKTIFIFNKNYYTYNKWGNKIL